MKFFKKLFSSKKISAELPDDREVKSLNLESSDKSEDSKIRNIVNIIMEGPWFFDCTEEEEKKKQDQYREANISLSTMDNKNEAIPILMEHFYKTKDFLEVSEAMQKIGTLSVIEPLLEIFRLSSKSNVDKNGFQIEDENIHHNDGTPCSALITIRGAIGKLKELCTADELEHILVVGVNYEMKIPSPEIAQILVDIGTTRSFGKLIHILMQTHRKENDRKPAKDALISAGKKAHDQLLEYLKKDESNDPKWRTKFRKELLYVLSASGDQNCIPTIKSVMDKDLSIADESMQAIQSISERLGNEDSYEIIEPKQGKIKEVHKTYDSFVDDIFQIDLVELYDGREWIEIPEAKAITEASNQGKIDEALNFAAKLQNKHPDYYFSFLWIATLRCKQKQFDDALDTIREGLDKSKNKFYLCGKMADIYWELKDLNNAVKWWIRSAVLQLSSEFLYDYYPFLNLSYVAVGVGNQSVPVKLLDYVDRIQIGNIRLENNAANAIILGTQQGNCESMNLALVTLNNEFLN